MDIELMEGVPVKISVKNHDGSHYETILAPTTVEIALDMDGVALDLDITKLVWNNRYEIAQFAIQWIKEGAQYLYNNEKGKALTLASTIDFSNGTTSKKALEQYQKGLGKLVDNAIDKKQIKHGMIKVVCALKGNSFVIRPATNQPIEEYNSIAHRLPDFLR